MKNPFRYLLYSAIASFLLYWGLSRFFVVLKFELDLFSSNQLDEIHYALKVVVPALVLIGFYVFSRLYAVEKDALVRIVCYTAILSVVLFLPEIVLQLIKAFQAEDGLTLIGFIFFYIPASALILFFSAYGINETELKKK